MEQLVGLAVAGLIIEKIIERIKEKFPSVQGWVTSVLALVLGIGLAVGVPVLRVLDALFGDANEYVDLVFTGLAIAAGSGFIASLEEFLRPTNVQIDGDIDRVDVENA